MTSIVVDVIMDNGFNGSHKACIACGDTQANPISLGLVFKLTDTNTVQCRYKVQAEHQGYQGILHGGVAAMLVDAAMVNWLQIHGITRAMTAELNLRYHQTIAVGEQVDVEAKLVEQRHKIYRLKAKLSVNEQIRVSAEAKFIRPPNTKSA